MSTVTDSQSGLTDRRDIVRKAATASVARRELWSKFFLGSLSVALIIAFIPLFSILQNVIGHGWHYITWGFLTQSQAQPSLFAMKTIGGIGNAISGTIVVDSLAVAISIPIALLLAVAFYDVRSRWSRAIRSLMETFIGLPSLLFGMFIFTLFVASNNGITKGYYGSLALCFIIVPVSAINALAALESVPATLIEAGLGLGARPSRVMWRIILPVARPRIMTGLFLAFARSVGETAPILFVIGVSQQASYSLNGSQTTLPTMMYDYLTGSYPSQRVACWGIALVLMTSVLVLNVISRIFLARANK